MYVHGENASRGLEAAPCNLVPHPHPCPRETNYVYNLRSKAELQQNDPALTSDVPSDWRALARRGFLYSFCSFHINSARLGCDMFSGAAHPTGDLSRDNRGVASVTALGKERQAPSF